MTRSALMKLVGDIRKVKDCSCGHFCGGTNFSTDATNMKHFIQWVDKAMGLAAR